jgi:hypothetical protein
VHKSSRNASFTLIALLRSKQASHGPLAKVISYPAPSQFNSFAGWMIGASMLAGALVFIARHVHV